jgi:hypothetical protein
MAGVEHEKILPFRKLSAGGVLGFHAPYLAMPDQKYSKEDVEVLGQGMREAFLGLVRLSSRKTKLGGEFLKKSLIERILEKGPQEVVFVKTIFDAARWDISIEDVEEHYTIEYKRQATINICNNFHYSHMDEPVPEDIDLSVRTEKYASRYSNDEVRIIVENDRTHDTVCELYPKQYKGDTGLSFLACLRMLSPASSIR